MTHERQSQLESRLGHRFANAALLEVALTHASAAGARVHSNERMEFLGDAVLGLVVCQRIYELYPDLLEGEMTKIKSTVVSRQTCAVIGDELGLVEFLSLGKGMKPAPGAPLPMSLSAAALESVIAAIYLDAGLEAARAFLLPRVESRIATAAASGHQENYKSILQHHAQQSGFSHGGGQPGAAANGGDAGEPGAIQATPVHGHTGPIYHVLSERGPDHSKSFEVAVRVGSRQFGPAWGASKKQAEQMAALNALRELGVIHTDAMGRVTVGPAPSPSQPAAPA